MAAPPVAGPAAGSTTSADVEAASTRGISTEPLAPPPLAAPPPIQPQAAAPAPAVLQLGAEPRDLKLQRPDSPPVSERDEESDRSQEEHGDADDPEKNDTCARRSWRDPAGGRPARVRGSARDHPSPQLAHRAPSPLFTSLREWRLLLFLVNAPRRSSDSDQIISPSGLRHEALPLFRHSSIAQTGVAANRSNQRCGPTRTAMRSGRGLKCMSPLHPFPPITVRVAWAFKLREIHECIRERLAVRIPFAQSPRERARFPSSLVPPLGEEDANVIDAKHIGRGVIDGVECEHLAFRNLDTDWQIWIEAGARRGAARARARRPAARQGGGPVDRLWHDAACARAAWATARSARRRRGGVGR